MAPRAVVLVSAPSGSWLKLRNRSSAKSSRSNERDEERTDEAGNEHGHERDQSARRMGDKAASTADRGERVTPGNGRPVTAADHRQQSTRATPITPAHLPANPHGSG